MSRFRCSLVSSYDQFDMGWALVCELGYNNEECIKRFGL